VSESKVIASRVIDPREPALFFKRKKSDPAEHFTITCSCESCPLRNRGECATIGVFSGFCPYGSKREETGPTQRAAKFGSWIRERKAMHPGIGWHLGIPTKKLAFVGEYVYFPYSHADSCKAVPFYRGGWIKRESWTLENVLTLIDFRPTALFGGEIASYQKESVPLFISHIRELDPEMWKQLIAARPQLDVTPNYVGRKALVKTLAYPITIPPHKAEYPVVWEWNGQTLTTTSRDAYGSTWGHIEAASVATEIAPSDKASVVVRDNAWVTPETVFVD